MTAALLVRLGGLGDLLVALPAIRLLRRAFPRTTLHLAGRLDAAELLRERRIVDAASSADDARWLPFFRDPDAAGGPRAGALWEWDLVVGWFHGGSGIARDDCRGPYLRIRYDPSSGRPISRDFYERTREFVRERAGEILSFEEVCRLPGPDAGRRDDFVVIHPGSGSAGKCWPLGRFLSLAGRLGERGYRGALVTGEAEERLAADLAPAALPAGWRWLRRPELRDLAGILETAAIYVGNDSGVTHLAAACGTRVVAIFRSEFETAWRPFGIAEVLAAPQVDMVSLDDVEAATARLSLKTGLVIR